MRVEGVLVEVLRVAVIVEVLWQVVDSIVRPVGGVRRRGSGPSRSYWSGVRVSAGSGVLG